MKHTWLSFSQLLYDHLYEKKVYTHDSKYESEGCRRAPSAVNKRQQGGFLNQMQCNFLTNIKLTFKL